MCYESTLASNSIKCVIKTTVIFVLLLMLYGCNEERSNSGHQSIPFRMQAMENTILLSS